jgi:hypothetical protein
MYLLCEKIEHFMDFYGQKRLVIAEDDVCYKKFTGLNEMFFGNSMRYLASEDDL